MAPEAARLLLTLGFSDSDKARMHALAVKNQESALAAEEREELDGYVKVGDLLAFLQSKAGVFLNRVAGNQRRHERGPGRGVPAGGIGIS